MTQPGTIHHCDCITGMNRMNAGTVDVIRTVREKFVERRLQIGLGDVGYDAETASLLKRKGFRFPALFRFPARAVSRSPCCLTTAR